jgi:cell division GTPase FtsZ
MSFKLQIGKKITQGLGTDSRATPVIAQIAKQSIFPLKEKHEGFLREKE